MAILSEFQLIINKKDYAVEKYTATQNKLRLRNVDLTQILSTLGAEVLLCYVSEDEAKEFFNIEDSDAEYSYEKVPF